MVTQTEQHKNVYYTNPIEKQSNKDAKYKLYIFLLGF